MGSCTRGCRKSLVIETSKTSSSIYSKQKQQVLQRGEEDYQVKGSESRENERTDKIAKTFLMQLNFIIKADIRDIYHITKTIGIGHFGTVKQGKLFGWDRKLFAIKAIDKKKIKNELNLLKRELEILKQVDHPNIVKFYEAYEDSKRYHIVMELCEGGELFDYITKKGQLEESNAAQIFQKILMAINHLHAQGICHRDIKPENFLFEKKGEFTEIKLIDFGLSNNTTQEQMDSLVGTPFYIAPEILKGQYSLKSDI